MSAVERLSEPDAPNVVVDSAPSEQRAPNVAAPGSLSVFRQGWRGDWRLEDERADREIALYYERSRSTEDFA